MPTRYLDNMYLLAGRRINPVTGTLSYGDVQKHLRRKELEVLALLAAADGEPVARSVFIEQIWRGNTIVGEQGLTDTVSALRRSLCDTDRENPLIQTIPRRGYQLRGSIRLVSRDDGVVFVAGSVIDGRPGWRLKQLLEQTDAQESWLAEDGHGLRRVFRFCRREQQLRQLRREVALMRYLREALADREDVSTILDWQLEEPPYFLELAAPACGNLRGVMLSKSVPDIAERWRLLQQVAEALAAVHAAGVVHRNLTPDSVLVDRRGSEVVALLGEFGLAALDDRQRLTALGIDTQDLSMKTGLLGPATAYTAPECVAGAPASAASDVYALGVLISQTARRDFQWLESSGFEVFPAGVAALLRQCIAVEPGERPTAAAVASRLGELTQPAARQPDLSAHAVPAATAEPPVTTAPAEAPQGAATAAPVAATVRDSAATAQTPPQVNQRIGRYRILEELAQGGMGVVYLAEQSEPVQRKVALKLIRAGLDSEQVLGRFEAERQALAMMNHPNISAIFDAGTTPGGYPYFVMEYVPGKDIKSHCDDGKLKLRARIRLFLQVCDGVLHAHQKGLIHRDLKPNNILVKQKAEQPALVKLIDFGIAKSLTGGLGHGQHTRIGSFIGTPVYSCPEQVINPTRDIDTRADLYSLGVVLYELLTGVPPRSAKELDADTPAELARRLRDTKTRPMGSRYADLSAEERQRIAELRAISEQGLSMQLGSDLDWIVGKCIAQDPEDRYATVQDLRKDLQCWLDNRPVEARPASVWYRFRKLVRRNRLNTALIASAVLALIGTTSAALVGYERANRARADAELVVDFQSSTLTSIDPARFGEEIRQELLRSFKDTATEGALSGNESKAKIRQFDEMLNGVNFTDAGLVALDSSVFDPALLTIRDRFDQNPEIQGQLAQALADTWFTLGRYKKSLETQNWALELRTTAFGRDDRRVLYSASRRAQMLWQLGKNVEAEAAYRSSLARMRATLGIGDQLTIATMNKFASLLATIDNTDEAIKILQEILAVADHFPRDDTEIIEAVNNFGGLMLDKGDLPQAREYITKALEGRRRLHGDLHRSTLNSLNDLSLVMNRLGEYAKADELSRQALDGYRQLAGERHPDTLQILGNFVSRLAEQSRFSEAEPYARQLLSARTVVLGENNPSTVRATISLGRVLNGIGEYSEAERLLSALGKRKASLRDTPPGHLLIAEAHLATALEKQGKYFAAAAIDRQILAGPEANDESNQLVRLGAMSHLALVLAKTGQLAEAESMQREAWKGLTRVDGEAGVRALLSMSRLTDVLRQRKQLAEASEMGQRLVELGRSQNPPGNSLLASYLTTDGQVQSAMGEIVKAEDRFREAWRVLQTASSVDPAHQRDLNLAIAELDARWQEKEPGRSIAPEEREWREALSKAVRERN